MVKDWGWRRLERDWGGSLWGVCVWRGGRCVFVCVYGCVYVCVLHVCECTCVSVYLERVCVCGRLRGGSGMRTFLSSGQCSPLSIPPSELGRASGRVVCGFTGFAGALTKKIL